ncbi:Glycerophosphodiester phosphodiesterase [Purpureocillium takamizusanense]|uniref:glycerophosphodiester phosphodiesterase n=1 Tax=Purpureocillium takamizusanense TaxID=2060973 RepID=A0A9Q8VGR2_9HYPO|nr:Glycerophosphodiester phosphodiesterase [Purpureocillium takamizusanense]UNI24903.1 Glycerophosphodiester phosphodiesterase [Purpureocillium takamizusanense]
MHLTPVVAGLALAAVGNASPCPPRGGVKPIKQIELGPRPYYLVNNMTDGPLKDELQACTDKPMKPSTWSIGHRGGAPLQFPEHSRESALAGARMGAGVLECDVAFTKDRELVCRHSQCDLHTTTNIVAVPELNAKCTQPFRPAADGKPASAKCCTSDITLAEFKSLCAKMDGANTSATNPQAYLAGTPSWRTDLYATCGTVLEHKEHIALVEGLGLRHTPELKAPEVKMPFQGNYTQDMYAQQLIDNYKRARVPAERVLAQSFQYRDVLYWLKAEPAFGKTAILLDESGGTPETYPQAVQNLTTYHAAGVRTVAPPLAYLVEATKDGKIAPSAYARRANELGLAIITWSLERSGPLAAVHRNGDSYYSSIRDVIHKDGDMYELLDVLYRKVKVAGLFSDWSATVTFYANCVGVGLGSK